MVNYSQIFLIPSQADKNIKQKTSYYKKKQQLSQFDQNRIST